MEYATFEATRRVMHPIKNFVRHYFFYGQYMAKPVPEKDTEKTWWQRWRKPIAFVLPPFVAWTIWASYMGANNLFYLFTSSAPPDNTPNWYMSITMAFGSFIAGSTSEGGASVAFPVMTLVYGIAPQVARHFSFAIQSCGMTSASATIIMMGIKLDKHALIYGSIGGAGGIIYGLEKVVPTLYPAEAKMWFVCIWMSFAAALFWMNRLHNRRTFLEVPDWDRGVLLRLGPLAVNWKACIMVAFGFLGGIFSAIGGAGLDICIFASLTLFFRVSEKVATPTSILLMAGNTLIGFAYVQLAQGGVEPRALQFLAVCIPIVVVCAPFGALCSSHWHRLVHASLVYVIDTAQLITALYVIKPWTHLKTTNPAQLCASSAALLAAGLIFFSLMAWCGQRLLLHHGYSLLSDAKLAELKHAEEETKQEELESGIDVSQLSGLSMVSSAR